MFASKIKELKIREDMLHERAIWREPVFQRNVWNKVGYVKAIYMYPLLHGKSEKVRKCEFWSTNEIFGRQKMMKRKKRLKEDGVIANHMFLVYNKTNHIVQTSDEMGKLTLPIPNIGDTYTLLRTDCLDLNKIKASKDFKTCTMFSDEGDSVTVNILDCDKKILGWNKWLVGFNTRSDLGLGLILRDEGLQKPHVQHAELSSEADGNRDTKMYFENMPLLKLTTCSSLTEIQTNPDSDPHPNLDTWSITPEDLNVNIIIEMNDITEPFSEVEWRYIKIGDAILHNVNKWDRKASEFQNMPLEMKMKKMLLHCEVLTPDRIAMFDNVYVLKDD